MKVKQTGQKEIGRIRLSENQDLVCSVVNDEKLDLRIWLNDKDYKGFTKRGVRFYLFDGIYEEFKRLIEKVDKVYSELA
jgi:hypothetical protein